MLTEAGVKSPRSWRFSVYDDALNEDAWTQTLVLWKISWALNYLKPPLEPLVSVLSIITAGIKAYLMNFAITYLYHSKVLM